MNLQSNDVNDYTVGQLMELFTLSPGFTEEALQLARQRLVTELPKLRKSGGIGRPHEVALFIDCASNRLRDEGAADTKGTWSQKSNPLVKGMGSRVTQRNASAIAGREAQIVGGRRAESGDVPPGWLNPINIRTTDFAMNIDSRFRSNYYSTSSTDWKMDLPVTQNKVSSMRVASLELPLSFYAISGKRGNATMLIVAGLIDQDSGPGMDAWLVTLPDGNYQTQSTATAGGEAELEPGIADALKDTQQGLYDPISGVFQQVGTGVDISANVTFSVDQASGKASFTAGNPHTLVFAVDPDGNRDLRQNLQLKLGWQLGFRAGFYEAPAQSESICSPCGPRYAYLAVDDGNNNHGSTLVASFAASSFSKDIMLRINLGGEVAWNGIYKYVSKAGIASTWWRSREYFGPVTISKLGFKLFDEYGRILDLNGMDWSMALVFESIYD